MNEILVNRLKSARNSLKLKQSDVARMIGVKGNTLSNYECGVSEPDIDTFCALCDIYGLDPAELLGEAYGLSVQGTEFDIKPSEIELLEKYRALNDHGREVVDLVLEAEYQNSIQFPAVCESNLYMLDAAHERTDIDVTDEMRKHDDDIMDDENF